MATSGTDRATEIYRIVNLTNGDLYIGVTCAGIAARRRSHLHAARNKTDRSRIYNAKLGEE